MAKPELLSHDTFYIKELNDAIDLRHDYDYWRLSNRPQVSKSN